MSGKRIDIELTTLGKSFAVFVLLLILSFVLGLYLGRESKTESGASGAEGVLPEQLAACTYKLQELTTKFTALSSATREKGLIDQNGFLIRGVTCTASDEESVKPPQDTALKNDPATDAQVKQDIKAPAPSFAAAQPSSCKYSLQIYAGRTREEAIDVQARSKIKPTRLIEGTVNGVTWHRLRYGCYPDKTSAESAVNGLLQLGARPIVVKEE